MMRNAMILGLVTVGLLASPGMAGVIATNEGITSGTMNAGGTAGDLAVYLYDNYTGSFSSYAIGSGTDYNEFHVYNGSTFTSEGSYTQKRIGSECDHNAIRVDASTFTSAGSGYSAIGIDGDYNTLEFTNGATGSLRTYYVGGNGWGTSPETGSYNSVIVDGSGTTVTTDGNYYLLFGANAGSYNTAVVSNGGKLDYSASSRVYIGYSGAASSNSITATGSGSEFSALSVRIGCSDEASNNNSLIASNSGLVKLGTTGIIFGAGTGNYVRLAAGYVAVSGNNTGELSDGQVLVWDGSAYVVGTKGTDWTATYYDNDAAAEAATGYTGLGGYTIFTGGVAVPEPATMSLLALGGLLALRRRRR